MQDVQEQYELEKGVAYVIEVIKLAAARSFRRTVNLSGRFGAECPGAMPGDVPTRDVAGEGSGLPLEQQEPVVSTIRFGER